MPKKFVIGLILSLLLCLLISEAILRSKHGRPPREPYPAGFKYDYVDIYQRFFNKTRLKDGKLVYKTQREGAVPKELPIHKDKHTKRVFILGGSVAKGLGNSTHLKDFLEEVFAPKDLEIVNCGMDGYDSYRVALIQKEIFNYEPDLIILLVGNNEFYPAFKFLRARVEIYRLNRILRQLWVYRMAQDKLVKMVPLWKTSGYFPTPEVRLSNFRGNLQIMVRRAKKNRIPMVLCTMPANFKDYPPQGSPLLEKQFLLARVAMEKENYPKAIELLNELLARHSQGSFWHYFLGRCYEMISDYSQAQEHYLKALDLDVRPGNRCPPQRNEVIRQICLKEGMILVDLERAFIKIAPYGLVGKEMFKDHCHWLWPYNKLVSKEIAEAILQQARNSSKSLFPPLDNWSHNLTLTNQGLLLKEAADEAKKISFSIWLESSALAFKNETDTISEQSISLFQAVHQVNPELLYDSRHLKEKLVEEFSQNRWSKQLVWQVDSRWPEVMYHVGEAYRRLKLYHEAIEYFNEAINLNPEACLPYLGKGLSLYAMGLNKKATREFDEAERRGLKLHPEIRLYREILGI